MQRQYIALVQQSAHLESNPEGTVTEPLMGKRGAALPASTVYRTLHSNQDLALLQLIPKTGVSATCLNLIEIDCQHQWLVTLQGPCVVG